MLQVVLFGLQSPFTVAEVSKQFRGLNYSRSQAERFYESLRIRMHLTLFISNQLTEKSLPSQTYKLVLVEHRLSPPPVSLIRQMSHSQSEQNWNVSSVSNSQTSSIDSFSQDDDTPPSPTCSELLEILLADIMK